MTVHYVCIYQNILLKCEAKCRSQSLNFQKEGIVEVEWSVLDFWNERQARVDELSCIESLPSLITVLIDDVRDL